MQKDIMKIGTKCPECKAGKQVKLLPLTVIAMPNECAWQRFMCRRCKGTGLLPLNDLGVRRNHVEPSKPWPRTTTAVTLWFWLFAGANVIAIYLLLWP